MQDLASYLPQIFVSAGVPAAAVLALFWKGDDALSPEFRQWLGEKVSGVGQLQPSGPAEGPALSILDALAKVFGAIYGRRARGFPSFLRVTVISTIAAFIVYLGPTIVSPRILEIVKMIFGPAIAATVVLIMVNAIFNYVAVTISLFILDHVKGRRLEGIWFLILDFLAMLLIAIFYLLVFESRDILFSAQNQDPFAFGLLDSIDFGLAFLLTIFLTWFLAALYIISTRLLVFVRFAGAPSVNAVPAGPGIVSRSWSTVTWVLPVHTLPIRSIGILAAAVVFLATFVTRLFI